MSSTLLERMRTVNRILQSLGSGPVSFNELCKVLSEVLNANVYTLSRKGRILGYALDKDTECHFLNEHILVDKKFPEEYNKELLMIFETVANRLSDDNICVLANGERCQKGKATTSIVPIYGSAERLGTLILGKYNSSFDDEDLVLAEYGATVMGIEILRSKHEEIEEQARKRAVVQMAIGTLSYSELEAVEHIFRELEGNEGLLIASKIADKVGITRSVIVNALRKFESAGVIESRSLGMKGTHIKILNDKLLDELKKLK